MVFEAIVVEVLNKFLKEYVINLDPSQLKLGIWGGDVVMNDLVIRDTALNDLKLPVKVLWGRLGKLVLKIPWKNLYGSPVVASIENLFIVVAPDSEIRYEEEKEKRWSEELKKSELSRIENMKKREMEKDAPKVDDTFVEKLVTQIIRNIQMKIENIHIRYEDKSTNINNPFCLGATISTLALETSHELMNNAESIKSPLIYKNLNLEGLAIYWNPSSDLIFGRPPEEMVKYLREHIPTQSFKPQGYQFLFGPISSSAKLILNPKPECDGTNFANPKVAIDISMDEFTIGITRRQFQDIMLLIDHLAALSKSFPFRMYRPQLSLNKGNGRLWWKYAYNCVLVDIRRRRDGWNWEHISKHRKICREYQSCYKKKLMSKQMPDLEGKIAELECILDVFNIVILRERATVDANKLQQLQQQESANRGWFGGWFSSSKPTSESEKFTADIAQKIENVLTPEEKSKLYRAIDYQENSSPMFYPETFVQSVLKFALKSTKVRIEDDLYNNIAVLDATLNNFAVTIEQRPSASALKACVSFGDFSVNGMEQSTGIPQLVKSRCHAFEKLVEIVFETNPLDRLCDQRVNIVARPLTIIYNAETARRLQDIFTGFDTENINEIKERTAASLPTFREMSSVGLQFAIERRARLDVKINVSSSAILIPYGGIYIPDSSILVVRLGTLTVETEQQKSSNEVSVKDLYLKGTKEDEIFKTIVSESYTKFSCRLTGVQVLISMKGEDWTTALKEPSTPLHLLQPTDLMITLKKSLISDDARIPQMIIEGHLPSIQVQIVEERLLALAALFYSIPKATESPFKESISSSLWSIASAIETTLLDSQQISTKESVPSEMVQGTNLVCKFAMKEFVVNIIKTNGAGDKLNFSKLSVNLLNVELVQKTFEMVSNVSLAGIDLLQWHENEKIVIVATEGNENMEHLFSATITSCDQTSPDFYTVRGGVLQRIEVKMSRLKVILHQEAILAQMQFANAFSKKMEVVKTENEHKNSEEDDEVGKNLIVHQKRRNNNRYTEMAAKRKRSMHTQNRGKRKKKHRVVVIDMMANVSLDEIAIIMIGSTPLSRIAIQGLTLVSSSRKSYAVYDIQLTSFTISDLDKSTLYETILKSSSTKTVTVKVTMYNEDTRMPDDTQMAVEVEMSQIKFVYLYRFLAKILEFSNNFQAAKEVVKEASTVAAEKARQNMKKVYEDATRILLKIDIKAPLIFVPLNSRSPNALVADLGIIVISNSFINREVENEYPAAIDVMRLDLRNLTLIRATVDPMATTVVYEYPLIKPVSVNVTVSRNLSASWYKGVPDVELTSRLDHFEVALDEEDYAFCLSVLQENHAEAGEINDDGKITQSKQNSAAKSKGKDREATIHIEETNTVDVHTTVLFTFALDNFVITLYPGGQKVVNEKNHLRRQSHSGLSRFLLETLAIKGKLLSDGSMNTSVKLVNCILEDIRSTASDRLTTLLERKQIESTNGLEISVKPPSTMIDITYQKSQNEQFIDVRVSGFTLIICVDYFMKLANFFIIAPKEESAPPIQTQKSNLAKTNPSTNKTVQPVQPSVEKSNESLKLNIRVEKPDIMLVENMDDINTDALVFHTELFLTFRQIREKKIISGSLNDFQLYCCSFNPEARKRTKVQVIKPMSMNVEGSTPDDCGPHIDLQCTSVNISVSPHTINLINACYGGLIKDQSKSGETDKDNDWSDIWTSKEFKDPDYWFLTTEQAVEVVETEFENMEDDALIRSKRKSLNEVCIISIPSIVISVEVGLGRRTIPMLLMELGIEGQARDWSSKLQIRCSLSVQMNYYNLCLATWEPVIEPLEVKKDGKHAFVPWQMNCEVTKSIPDETGSTTSVNFFSKDTLEITVTKTCLEVLTQLGESFSNAVREGSTAVIDQTAPHYLIRNESGLIIQLLLGSSKLQHGHVFKENTVIDVYDQTSLTLAPTRSQVLSPSRASHSLRGVENVDTHFVARFPECNMDLIEIPLGRRAKRCYANRLETKKEKWTVLVDITTEQNATVVVFRSIVRILNHFSVPVHIYRNITHVITQTENELEFIGTVQPKAEFNVPSYAVYTDKGEFFFCPDGFSVSNIPFSWISLQNEISNCVQVKCKSKNEESTNPFFIKVVGELDRAYFRNTLLHTIASRCYNIHLTPTVELLNALPTTIIICTEGSINELTIKPGDKAQLPQVDPAVSYITIRLPNYLDKEWVCWTDFSDIVDACFAVWSFESYDGDQSVSLHLGVSTTHARGTIFLTLYCPFWIINKTGFTLAYKFDDGVRGPYAPVSYTDPIMLSPGPKNFMGKKKGMIKVEQGSWSDKFSLDVAGSGGIIECKSSSGKILKLSVTIRLSQNTLTKILLITPGYVFVNKTDTVLEVCEKDYLPNSWLKFEPDGCSGFWPSQKMTSVVLRVAGTAEISSPFQIHSTYSCLLQLRNKYGGVFVDVQCTSSGIYISFNPYEPGLAPVLIFNHTTEPLVLWEKGLELTKIGLQPNYLRLYAWDKPSGTQQIVWRNGKNEEIANSLIEDFSDVFIRANGTKVWCSSFLDGMQRILLFTESEEIVRGTQGQFTNCYPTQDIKIDIQGIGLSIVNNINKTELIYIGLVSSGIVWEERKIGHRRYKPLQASDSALIEKAHSKYEEDLKSNTESPVVVIDNRLKISFENMEMLEPHRRDLRRTFTSGLHLLYQTYEYSNVFHLTINRLQIDNQMYNCVFPVILAPVPPPKTVSADQRSKPFLELSIFERISAHSLVKQYQYFKILIQEFHIKLDIGFVQAISEFLAATESSDVLQKSRFLRDLELSKAPLHSHVILISSQEQKNFYDLLHFSPLKVHLSFSLAGNVDNKTLPSALSGLLQSLGVTLTDINDAVFRLSCMERKNAFRTMSQVQNEAKSHYIGQALRQAYVIIFGLDVIGNPFGLVVGISEGVEALFYEPFQGMIQGPADFAEGLSLGVRSLFGHTVGGAAGAFGRITGTIGKGLAALSLDKEYQQKRLEQQKQGRNDNLQVQMAQGGKGLVMGVVEGVTGVVTKPISGAKQEGVGGFFKGMGKGVVGLVTRPVSGVVDFASTSLNVVKRATDMTEEASRMRSPRFFREDAMTPYRANEAYGSKVLYELSNGRYLSTDVYESHLKLSPKEIILLSNKRVIIAHISDLFGVWQENFVASWCDLAEVPSSTPKGIMLVVNKKKAGVFGQGRETKVLSVQNPEKENLLRIMKNLYAAERKSIVA